MLFNLAGTAWKMEALSEAERVGPSQIMLLNISAIDVPCTCMPEELSADLCSRAFPLHS